MALQPLSLKLGCRQTDLSSVCCLVLGASQALCPGFLWPQRNFTMRGQVSWGHGCAAGLGQLGYAALLLLLCLQQL